jgi:hypothetical protein
MHFHSELRHLFGHPLGVGPEESMITLFIVFGALILAVIGRAILEPVPAREQSGDGAVGKERQQMMEAIAMSVF